MVLTKYCQHFGRASRCVLLAIALALLRATLFQTSQGFPLLPSCG